MCAAKKERKNPKSLPAKPP